MNRIVPVLLAVLVTGSLAMGFLVPAKEGHAGPGHQVFYAVLGFAGCFLLIHATQALGRFWLKRSEAYYTAFRAPQPGEDAEPKEEGR